MLIRTEQVTDIPKIHAINRAAFDAATEANLVDVLRSGAENVISLVAEEDGEIVAVFVVGHPRYYPRFGFKSASSVGFACEFVVPDEAFMELAAGVLDGKTATVHFHPAFKEGDSAKPPQ